METEILSGNPKQIKEALDKLIEEKAIIEHIFATTEKASYIVIYQKFEQS